MGVDLISSEINVIGNLVGSYSDLVALMALAAQQKVSLHTAKYPMDEFQRALDDLGAGRVRGRAILVPLTGQGRPAPACTGRPPPARRSPAGHTVPGPETVGEVLTTVGGHRARDSAPTDFEAAT
jgi:hypothetical protein